MTRRLDSLLDSFREPPSGGPALLGRYLRSVFGRTLAALFRLSDQLKEGASRDLTHDIRVLARRLMEHLDVLAPMAPPALEAGSREFLQSLVRALSPLRNADESRLLVRDALEGVLSASEREALLYLDRALKKRRRKKLQEALGMWERDRTQERLAELAQLRRALTRPGRWAKEGFPRLLAAHLERRVQAAHAHLEKLPPEPDDRQLHAMRLDIRRLRYMGEATRASMGWPPAPKLKRLTRVAQVLGEHHDLAVAVTRIGKVRSGLDSKDPEDAALLMGLGRAEARFRRLQAGRLRAFRRLTE